MPLITFPNSFSPGTRAKSSEVNANFAIINTWLSAGSIEHNFFAQLTGQVGWNITSTAAKAINIIQATASGSIEITQSSTLPINGAIVKITDNSNELSTILGMMYLNMSSLTAVGAALRIDYATNTNFLVEKDTVRIPKRTTAQRNSISGPQEGMELYNSDNKANELYDGANWRNIALPPGVIMPYVSNTAPSGWLVCDGASYSSVTHPALFTVISAAGYPYGGSGLNFNVPDMRGRTPIGSGTGSGLTTRTLGNSFGNETHTLSSTEMPAHSHDMTHNHGGSTVIAEIPHTHTVQSFVSQGAFDGAGAGFNFLKDAGIVTTSSTNPNHSHGIPNFAGSTGGAGGSGAHNNMQPNITVNYIIKL